MKYTPTVRVVAPSSRPGESIELHGLRCAGACGAVLLLQAWADGADRWTCGPCRGVAAPAPSGFRAVETMPEPTPVTLPKRASLHDGHPDW